MAKVDKKLAAAKESDAAKQIYNRVMSNSFHVAIQKGRIMGRMEAAGKTVEEIAKAVSVPVESVKKMMEEDPTLYVSKWHAEVEQPVEENNKETENEKNTDTI